METGPTPSEELSSTSQAPQSQQYKPPPQRPPPQVTTTTVQSTVMAQPGMAVYPVDSCRNSARIVAYIDIVLGIIAILVSLFIVVAILILSNHVSAKDQSSSQETDLTVVIVFGFIAGILAVCHFIDICISCSLLAATEVGTPPSVAIGKAKCWLCFNVILLVITICGAITSSVAKYYWGLGNFLFFVIRVIFVIIVWKFIKELEISEAGQYLGYAGAQPITTTAMAYQQQPYQQQYQPKLYQQPYQQQHQQQPYQQPYQQQQQQPYQQQPYRQPAQTYQPQPPNQ